MNVPAKVTDASVDEAVENLAHYGLVPQTMAEAMQLAEMMARAKLVPVALQKSPADCLMVIQAAIRWRMDAFAVAQECSVIQGKLMYSGKLVAAVVNARGGLTQRLSFEYSGEGDDRTITVSGQLRGEPEPRVIESVFKTARTANTWWTKQPDQQLMYHGVRVWARRHTPELMLGVWSEEEFDDRAGYDPPVQHRRPPPPAPNAMIAPAHNIDFETGELTQVPPPAPNNAAVEQAAPPDNALPAGGAVPLTPFGLEDMGREAALRGETVFRKFYKSRSPEERETLNAMGDELRALMP